MNKKEFLSNLEKSLSDISAEEKADILYDYDEHFNIGIEKNKSEEEIAASLGNPITIARQYRADYMVKRAETHKSTGNIFRAVLAIIGLGFFNIVIVLGPFLAVAGCLLAFFATALSLGISGVLLFLGILFAPLFPAYVHLPAAVSSSTGLIAAGLLASVGITALGLLIAIGTYYLSRIFYNLTIKYLKLNISIVNNKEV